ncbi:MAG: hypothetical protein R2744_04845 [Bacteroidales bacterium]
MGRLERIRKDIFEGKMDIELYNLSDDPQETTNVAEEYPVIVEKIREIMKLAHRQPVNDRFRISQLGDSVAVQ